VPPLERLNRWRPMKRIVAAARVLCLLEAMAMADGPVSRPTRSGRLPRVDGLTEDIISALGRFSELDCMFLLGANRKNNGCHTLSFPESSVVSQSKIRDTNDRPSTALLVKKSGGNTWTSMKALEVPISLCAFFWRTSVVVFHKNEHLPAARYLVAEHDLNHRLRESFRLALLRNVRHCRPSGERRIGA
jgi:hypothetical protein